MAFEAGQRWFSQAEPDLGLGIVIAFAQGRVTLAFPALETERVYAADRAPLQRYEPGIGQTIEQDDGQVVEVDLVHNQNGLRVYQGHTPNGERLEIPETRLGTELALAEAADRLYSGQVNRLEWYDLRRRRLERLARHRRSLAYGYSGARVERLPHQLAVATRATRQGLPRVLLADEVGLGKTVEAGLILTHLRVKGQAERTLIHVPDALQTQWLTEMIRKFDLLPRVLTTEQWRAEQAAQPTTNPFESAQCVLVGPELWSQPDAREQVLAAHWDLLILDEAHQWFPAQTHGDPEVNALLNRLVQATPGVLLLSATPERGGRDAEFARLQALLPRAFTSAAQWQADEQGLAELGTALTAWLEDPDKHQASLDPWLARDPYGQELAAACHNSTDVATARQTLAEHLLDVQAYGLVQFRNLRSTTAGFPERHLQVTALPCPPHYALSDPFPETSTDLTDWPPQDPRASYLTELARQDRARKLLVICRHSDTATRLSDYLSRRQGLTAATFTEHMNLIARDRAAAWFAEPVDGAQILVCSEIGSEGRNFQFAHTLVLFDLPEQPGLLEQRIGRLDRIGQTHRVDIHLPLLTGHISEHWYQWYQYALDALENVCAVGQEVLDRALGCTAGGATLYDLDLAGPALATRIRTDRACAEQLAQTYRSGRQTLMSWASGASREQHTLADALAQAEIENPVRPWALDCLERFGYRVEDLGDDLYQVAPGDHQLTDSFPLGRSDDSAATTITFSRHQAVQRDDVRFITWEHSLIDFLGDTLDQLHLGRAGVTLIQLPGVQPGQLFLEAIYHPLTRHPAANRLALHLDQTPHRQVCDHQGKDLSRVFRDVDWRTLQQPLDRKTLMAIIKSQQAELRTLVGHNQRLAEPVAERRRHQAEASLDRDLSQQQNDIDLRARRTGRDMAQAHHWAAREHAQLQQALARTDWHQDSVRLIVTH